MTKRVSNPPRHADPRPKSSATKHLRPPPPPPPPPPPQLKGPKDQVFWEYGPTEDPEYYKSFLRHMNQIHEFIKDHREKKNDTTTKKNFIHVS